MIDLSYFKESSDWEDYITHKAEEAQEAKQSLNDFIELLQQKYTYEEIFDKLTQTIGAEDLLILLIDSFIDDPDFYDYIHEEGEYDSFNPDDSMEMESLGTQIYNVDLKADNQNFQKSVTAESPSDAKKQVKDTAKNDFKGSNVQVLNATRTNVAKNGLNQYTPESIQNCRLDEASVSTYEEFIDRTRDEFGDLITKTQSELNNSDSKAEDYYILNKFWGEFMPEAIEKWEDSSTLFLDDKAMLPMPESVSKQFVNRLFDITNLNVLYDIPVDEGFEDWNYYIECSNAEDPYINREEAIKEYKKNFGDEPDNEESKEEEN